MKPQKKSLLFIIGSMLNSLGRCGEASTSGTCQDSRGLESELLIENAQVETVDLSGEWTFEADTILVF